MVDFNLRGFFSESGLRYAADLDPKVTGSMSGEFKVPKNNLHIDHMGPGKS